MTSRKLPKDQLHLFPDSTAQSGPTIRRSRHDGCYTVIANEGVTDKRLSLDTKGLLWWSLTKPDDWQFIWSYIADIFDIGHTVVERMRCELQDAGYLERKQVQTQKGRFAEVQYTLFEAPSEKSSAAVTSANRDIGNPSAAGTCSASPKQRRGANQHAAGASADHDVGNPSAASTRTATPFTAQRFTRSTDNGRLLNTERLPITERHQEGAFAADGFEAFWQVYPRKRDKGAARKAYAAALKKTTAAELLAGAQRYAQERADQEHKFTKYPATWLNGECWGDEPQREGPAGKERYGEGEWAGIV